MHGLKIICLLCWATLVGLQLALPWLSENFWLLLLVVPLLIPTRGLLTERRYTYKWIGFLAMLYFCIGISELFANPELQVYGLATTIASTLLFLASIYYARYLGSQRRD